MNINQASAEQLERTAQIDGTRARYLVDYRREHGDFESWEEIKRVPSYEEGMVERLQSSGFTLGGHDGSASGGGRAEDDIDEDAIDEDHVEHDLNRASAEELEQTHMIDGERAQRLVEFREEHGDFTEWEQIKAVSGFEEGLVERLQQAGFDLGRHT